GADGEVVATLRRRTSPPSQSFNARASGSERLHRHLAKLDRARAVLQSERPFLEDAGANLGGLLAIEHHGEIAAAGGDLIGVPLAGRLRHRIDLGEIDDCAGAVARIRSLVEYVHLIAGARADHLGIDAVYEDAAVGFLVGPELGIDHVVLVFILGEKKAALALVGDDGAVLDAPIGLAGLGKAVEALAVEQLSPAGAALGEGALTERNGKRERCRDDAQAFHDVS